jgi:hypothetical protein
VDASAVPMSLNILACTWNLGAPPARPPACYGWLLIPGRCHCTVAEAQLRQDRTTPLPSRF